ncbi:MAG: class I SAM-dependent methyltransferase [Methylomonas sp.]
MYNCPRCDCAYLDPTPSLNTIGLAYKSYYTHDEADIFSTNPSGLQTFRRALSNGYRNWRYGTNYSPATWLGVVFAYLTCARVSIDRAFRYLPKAKKEARVLDVGFGSGSFLRYAKDAGWMAAGVDTDPQVIEAAKSWGCQVRQGGIEAFADEEASFDLITMNHVIEHLHEPRKTLDQVFKLLKPGGKLWLETPNITSFSHEYYGRNWRGLEPPRHLIIFNAKALTQMLAECGFISIQFKSQPFTDTIFMFKTSERIKLGVDPNDNQYRVTPWLAWKAILASFFKPEKAEFISLICKKPENP